MSNRSRKQPQKRIRSSNDDKKKAKAIYDELEAKNVGGVKGIAKKLASRSEFENPPTPRDNETKEKLKERIMAYLTRRATRARKAKQEGGDVVTIDQSKGSREKIRRGESSSKAKAKEMFEKFPPTPGAKRAGAAAAKEKKKKTDKTLKKRSDKTC